MPRIAAALAIFAAAAFSIGFNIVQYPIVWEKLAASESPSQSAVLTQPTSAHSNAWDTTDTDLESSGSADKDTKTARRKRVVASISAGDTSQASSVSHANGESSYEDDQEWSWDDAGEDPAGESDDGNEDRWDSDDSGSYASSYSDGADEYDSDNDSYGTYDSDSYANTTRTHAGAKKKNEPADRSARSGRPAARKGKKPPSRHGAQQKYDRPKEAGDNAMADGGRGKAQWNGDDQFGESDAEGLVPVDRPGDSTLAADGSGFRAGNRRRFDSGQAGARDEVRPLPSVNDWEEGPHSNDSSQFEAPPDEYPSTADASPVESY